MKTQLDKEKLVRLIKLHDKNYQWIADNLGWSRQLVHYHIKNRTLKFADEVAPLFGLKGKDLMR
jgi:hypothetical protein